MTNQPSKRNFGLGNLNQQAAPRSTAPPALPNKQASNNQPVALKHGLGSVKQTQNNYLKTQMLKKVSGAAAALGLTGLLIWGIVTGIAFFRNKNGNVKEGARNSLSIKSSTFDSEKDRSQYFRGKSGGATTQEIKKFDENQKDIDNYFNQAPTPAPSP